MANKLLLKRSAVPGKVPALADLQLGELGLNTYDGKLFARKDSGTPSIVEIGATGGAAWGSITGTLSSQTDLQNALDAKAYLGFSNTFTGNNVFRGRTIMSTPEQESTGIPITNLGNPTITEMALFEAEYTNKTRFFPVSNIVCEYTTDGTNWVVDPNATDIQKRRLVSGAGSINPAGLNIATNWQRYRITFNNYTYVFVGSLYSYLSTSGSTLKIKMWRQQVSDSLWVKFADSETAFSNWPGHVYLPFENTPWSTAAGQHKAIRVEFIPTWSGANPVTLYHVELWGGYPISTRELYLWDEDKNAFFPGAIKDLNTSYSYIKTTLGSAPTISNGTAAPSGGSPGDVYMQYT